MERGILKSILSLIGGSATIVSVTYALNILFLQTNQRLRPIDAAFLEGVVFVILGILFFLGSGGINNASRQAAALAAAASAISGRDVIGPSEILRRDAWKPKSHTLFALILVLSGALLIGVYFVGLHFS